MKEVGLRQGFEHRSNCFVILDVRLITGSKKAMFSHSLLDYLMSVLFAQKLSNTRFRACLFIHGFNNHCTIQVRAA